MGSVWTYWLCLTFRQSMDPIYQLISLITLTRLTFGRPLSLPVLQSEDESKLKSWLKGSAQSISTVLGLIAACLQDILMFTIDCLGNSATYKSLSIFCYLSQEWSVLSCFFCSNEVNDISLPRGDGFTGSVFCFRVEDSLFFFSLAFMQSCFSFCITLSLFSSSIQFSLTCFLSSFMSSLNFLFYWNSLQVCDLKQSNSLLSCQISSSMFFYFIASFSFSTISLVSYLIDSIYPFTIENTQFSWFYSLRVKCWSIESIMLCNFLQCP